MTIILPRGLRPAAPFPAPPAPSAPSAQGTPPQQQWGHDHIHPIHPDALPVVSVAVRRGDDLDRPGADSFIKINTSQTHLLHPQPQSKPQSKLERPPLRRVPTPLDPSLALLLSKPKSAIDTNPSPASPVAIPGTPAAPAAFDSCTRQAADPFSARATNAGACLASDRDRAAPAARNAPEHANSASPAPVPFLRAPRPDQVRRPATRDAHEAHLQLQTRDCRDLDSEYQSHVPHAHRRARPAKPLPALVTSLTGASHTSPAPAHRPHDPRSSLELDVPVSASSEFDHHSYWSTSSRSHSSHGHTAHDAQSADAPHTRYYVPYVPHVYAAKDASTSYASDARALRAPPPPVSAARPAAPALGASPQAPAGHFGPCGPSGSTTSHCCPPDSASNRPKPANPAAAVHTSCTRPAVLNTSLPSPPRATPVSSSSSPTTPTTPSPTKPRRRPSFSKGLSNLREHFARGRSRSFSDQGHEPVAPLPPVPRVPSVYLDLATDLPRQNPSTNTGGMSLLRKMTKKREQKEAPRVAPPANARNILAEMGAQSEQLRRRPTLQTQHQQPPAKSQQPPSSFQQPQAQLQSQPSIRCAGARNVLKEMGAASDQIRARPPGSHPGRPGPRHRPRPKRQGTFEAIVVGQLPPQDDDEPEARTDALAKLTGEPVGIPIRHPPSPGTDSSSAPESTPPEVSLLGLEIDPSALRKPVQTIEIDPTAFRKPTLPYDDDDMGLPYDAPVAEKIVFGAPAYGSSPSDYGGEDLIDSYLDRSPSPPPPVRLPAVAPVAPGQVMHGQVMPGQVMPSQIMPSQIMPGQVMPGQVMPGQVMPGQVMPGQVMPGQVMPGQVVPSQTVREVVVDSAAPNDVVDHHTRAFLASRGMAPDSDDDRSSSDHAAVRPYGSESGHSSQASHMRRAYESDLGHGSQLSHAASASASASVQSHGSVRRARPEHRPPAGQQTRSRSSSRARERRDSSEKEKEKEPGLFRKASQLGRKLSTKHARKWSREGMPPLPGAPPTSFDAGAMRQAEQGLERKSCKPTIHTSATLATEISQVRNKDDAAQMEALFLV